MIAADFTKPKWQQDPVKFTCDFYVPHVDFDPALYGSPFDIAVVILREKFDLNSHNTMILPPCVANVEYEYGTAIGLGLTNQKERVRASVLMEAVLKKDDSCGEYNHRHIDRLTQICYSVPGRASICDGDSGGPLIYREGTIYFTLPSSGRRGKLYTRALFCFPPTTKIFASKFP